MSKFSNNLTPSLLLEAQTATPALTNATGAMVAGQFRLFLQGGVLKLVDFEGNVTSQFPAGTTGSIFYQDSTGAVQELAIGATGQVLTVAAGLPSWATPTGGGGGGGGGGGVDTPLTYSSDGDANGLFHYLGALAGGGSWINPCSTPFLSVNTNGGQFSSDNNNIVCMTDRATGTGGGQYDCCILGAGTTGQSALFDLGPYRTFKPNKFCYQNRGAYNSDGTHCYAAPAAMILEGSNDNVTFTTLGTLTVTTDAPSSWNDVAITDTVAYRYLRVTKTAASSSEDLFCIGELEMYGVVTTATGAPILTMLSGGTPIASPQYSGYTASMAFDGDTGTYNAGATTSGEWIGMDFGTNKNVVLLRFFTFSGDPTDFASSPVQTSTDGVTWGSPLVLTPASLNTSVWYTFFLPASTNTRYIRVQGNARSSVGELQFYGY